MERVYRSELLSVQKRFLKNFKSPLKNYTVINKKLNPPLNAITEKLDTATLSVGKLQLGGLETTSLPVRVLWMRG